MRRMLTLVLGAALALPVLSGCTLLNAIRNRDGSNNLPVQPDRKVDTASLVNYLNKNAERVSSVQASVEVDAKQGNQAIALSGALAAQKPRGFRLRAKVFGKPAVDIGSNDERFWYWISQANPPHTYTCTYKDLARGTVNVPFPVDTDMVLAAMNMAEYDPKGKYELKTTDGTLELTQDVTSPSGQAVKRTTVFNSKLARAGDPQVIEHRLSDGNGKLICRAKVQRVEVDRASGAVIPTRVVIEWPAQSVSMKLMLSDLRVNKIDREGASRMFTLDTTGNDIYDLARGAAITPSSQRQATTQKPAR